MSLDKHGGVTKTARKHRQQGIKDKKLEHTDNRAVVDSRCKENSFFGPDREVAIQSNIRVLHQAKKHYVILPASPMQRRL